MSKGSVALELLAASWQNELSNKFGAPLDSGVLMCWQRTCSSATGSHGAVRSYAFAQETCALGTSEVDSGFTGAFTFV